VTSQPLRDRPITPVPKPTKSGGRTPKEVGKRAEREVAKKLGGDRIPGSGALKKGPRDLTGDVQIPDADGRPYIKAEVKVCGTLDALGRKSFRVTWEVVDQMIREAETAGQLGILDVHFKGESYGHDLIVMKAAHFQQFLEDAKAGRAVAK
jgi:hypothetical protein